MNQIVISPQNSRADFERVLSLVAQNLGISEDQVKDRYKVAPMTMLLAAPLSNTQQNYTFYPVQGAGPTVPVPQLQMNKNDWFGITNIGVLFAKADFASGSGQYSNTGNFPKFSYPDPNYFTGAPASQKTEAECLQTVVNGTLQLTVSADPVILATPVRDFVFNPQSTFLSSPLTHPQLGPDKISRGYSELTPNILLDGNSDNQFTITLAPGATTDLDGSVYPGTTAATTRNILYLAVTGYIVKNSADGGTCTVRSK